MSTLYQRAVLTTITICHYQHPIILSPPSSLPYLPPSPLPQMLSLSLLDSIISLDWQGSWLRFMSQRGFLQTLCASIQWEDESLQKMLHPAPEALKALYIYESKMVRALVL